jgi:hypothetical protein
MSAIDTAMLSAMRSAIGELLPDTGQVISITNVSDGEGGQISSRGTTTAVNCRVDYVNGIEQKTGGALQPYSKIMLSIPYDTTITEENEFLHNGTTYAVKSVNDDQSWIAVKRCELEKL